jgi:hypothetical protein
MSKEVLARIRRWSQPESQHPPSKKPVKLSSAGQLKTPSRWDAPRSDGVFRPRQNRYFPEQDLFPDLGWTSREDLTMNPVDAVYLNAMMAGYESIASIDSTTNVFDPTDISYLRQHSIYDEHLKIRKITQYYYLSLTIDADAVWTVSRVLQLPCHFERCHVGYCYDPDDDDGWQCS